MSSGKNSKGNLPDEMHQPNALDEVYEYIKNRAAQALVDKGKNDKFLKLFEDVANVPVVEDFIRDPDVHLLFVYFKGDSVACSSVFPTNLKKKALYLMKDKNVKDSLTMKMMREHVLINEVSGNTLKNLQLIAQEVYYPLLSNPNNREGWSGPASKDIMLKMSGFLASITMTVGQSNGQTILPPPPPEAFDEDNIPEKERRHLLETSVVLWSDKVMSVIDLTPETLHDNDQYPDPMKEVEFWSYKTEDLKLLETQLNSEALQSVLVVLTDMKSPFSAQLQGLTTEVQRAYAVSADNYKHLRALTPHFKRLSNCVDISGLVDHFQPLLHCMLLLWNTSAHYNTNDRLTTLMHEICNAIIAEAEKFLTGELIFRQIEDENVTDALHMLRTAIHVCTQFKSNFHKFQQRAYNILPAGSWNVDDDLIFHRLDSYVSRCNDISDLCKIVVEFSKLEKIFIGGTKGAQLTKIVREIHADFFAAIKKFQNVPYDILNINNSTFDDDFYTYRCTVKVLDARLAAVLSAAFDDAATLSAQFKLLDSFEGIIDRPILKDELERKQFLMTHTYLQDILRVQEHFHSYRNTPFIDANMPPVAGAVGWLRGLRARVTEPMEKLRQYALRDDNEDSKEVERAYELTIAQLDAYEAKKIDEWTNDIDQTAQEKLRQPLLSRDKESRTLRVNFDDALIRLLREVKYLLSFGIRIVPHALTVYDKSKIYRQQTSTLNQIVSMYNEIMETLLPVEQPLIEKDIAHINEILEKGVIELNWKSPAVNEFISDALAAVKQVHGTVMIMKNNYQYIKKTMTEFAKEPMVDRKTKPMVPIDFEENFQRIKESRHKLIQQHQEVFTSKLLETCTALNAAQGSPIWRAYVDFVQEAIRDGLALAIVNSIKFFCEQIDQSMIEKNGLQPMLEIKLILCANDVIFSAEEPTANASTSTYGLDGPRKLRRDVWQMVNEWVESLFDIGNRISRHDSSHYVGDLKKNESIVRFINTLKKHADINQRESEQVRQEYTRYDQLYKLDRNIEFNKFLSNAIATAKQEAKSVEKVVTNEDDEDAIMDTPSDNDFVFPLDKFEEKIQYYKQIQIDIAEKKNVVEVGFLRINTQPIKNSLIEWAGKWIQTYTSYLYNDVTRKLNQLESLMNEVSEGIMLEVKPGDSETLKRVLGYIHQVRSKVNSHRVDNYFNPMRDTVALLKKHGVNLDEYELKLLGDASVRWDSVVDSVYLTKEKINVLQNDEVDKIKDKVRKFNLELAEFREHFRDEAPFLYDIEIEDAYEDIYVFHRRINQMEVKANKLNDLEKVFELTVSSHSDLKRTRTENRLLKQLWDMVSVVRHTFVDWRKTLWNKIDTDVLISEANKLRRQIQLLPPEVRAWNVYEGLVNEVKNLGVVLPMVDLLHSPFMEDRHWEDIKIATNKQFEKDESFCLDDLLNLELHKHVDEVEYIVELAKKEANIASQLEKIEAKWVTLYLEFGKHAKKEGFNIIHKPDEILATLEEHMSILQSMQGQGKYVEYFIDKVNLWQTRLNIVEVVLNDWLDVQKKWGSLESIFLASQDIKSQLPEDSNRFDEIDATWRELMANATDTSMVLDACQLPGRAEMLATLKVGLEQCEKSLYQYLEMKRKTFPRFYFISNVALLEMLSTSDDPHAVQKHLADCFDNLHHLEFKPVDDSDNLDTTQLDRSNSEHKVVLRTPGPPPKKAGCVLSNTAIGMHSKEGEEYVPFHEEFECTGAVENWLARLVQRMRDTLKEILARAKFAADHWEIEKPRHRWLFDYPAQIALTASQIIWTEEVNTQFDSFQDGNEQAMKEYAKVLAVRLEELITLVLGELTYEDRVKIMTLITIDVHNRDVVAKLIDQKVTESQAFAWQSQMRYSWEDQEMSNELIDKTGDDLKECYIKVADGTWTYSYEYVGNTGRLVITPLTDRCYITLTQALRLIMGGAPAGPAGTGKTETTKDLGRAFGLSVVVWNCSEQMNVQSMSAIFKGLSQTGAWGCFDEFNRIQIEVLSVISTQVATVLNAIRSKREEFDFMGDICRLVPTVGIFITMNPGYAGRTELPENVKALFRSCAMVVPDMDLICENMLMSEGFLQAQRLTKKFVTLYALCADLLSKQRHYDWGLRAFKAVLRVAGGLKRADPDVDENRILMRALRDFNLPKLVDADKPIFRQLIDDLFPGLSNTSRKYDKNLEAVIQRVAVQNRQLQPEERFDRKCVELSEILVIRHSVFIVGPPASGKSEIWKTLAAAYNEMGNETVYDVINPKAVLNKELYGWLSKTDWHDGILSTLIRNMSRNLNGYTEEQYQKWVVLDGDIDPDWIESINSAMDDNKMLTLVSNERIPLTKPMRLVFEISNLDNATPATVSRAGILYINANDIGSKPFLDSWVEKRPNDKEKSSLLALLNRYTTPECLNEILGTFRRIIPISEINMIRTLCYLLEGLLENLNESHKELRKKGVTLTPAQEKEAFEATFVFACIWAFGSAVFSDKSGNTRNEFSDWWKRVFTTVKFPGAGTVYDYYVDPYGQLVPWSDMLTDYQVPVDGWLVSQIFVPTVESVRMKYLLDLLVEHGKPALLVGGAGTGKTKLTLEYLKYVRATNERKTFANININYYTDAKTLQRILESHIDKRVGRIYGPVGNKKLVYLIDDLNMAQVDTYGTQSAMQLIKQQMDYGFWYDTTKLEKKEVRDVQFLACMNPTAGSFTVSDRLQGMFATFAIGMPDQADLRRIYGTLLGAHLSDFTKGSDVEIADMGEQIIKATVDLYDIVATKFLPSTKKFHYQFNLRDLSAIVQGLCQVSPKQVYTPKMFVQLWQHECSRVFGDRLVDQKDVQTFESLLEIKSRDHFKKILNPEGGSVDSSDIPVFASFVQDPEGGAYLPVSDNTQLKQCLGSKLDEYNNNNAVMNLELFTIAMHHICRIVRIIENPMGNALLIGVGGSGKQSLTRLAAHIAGYTVVGLNVSQDYSYHDLRADLQDMYKKAGVKRLPLVFMLTDTQILNDEWLSFVNDLLCSGYIPGLFTDEDLDGILASVRNEAKAKGVPDNREALLEFFISQVRANLHVVLCFSPVGDTFRVRCRKFPGILNNCVIDWFHPWPRDALVSVARRFLQDMDLGEPEVLDAIAEHMAMVHLSVDEFSQQYTLVHRRHNYTTPKSFLELINFYKMLLNDKRSELIEQVAKLERGIQTLNSTHEDVNKLKEHLAEKLVVVAEKKESAEAIISKIAVERKKVNDQRQIAAQEASKAKAVSEVCAQISEECKRDLDAAMPIKQKAEEAVKCLSRNSLTVLKNLANPTLDITYTTQAVMILRNFPGKRTWQNAKIMMKDVGRFMEELLAFDATEISDDTLKKLQPILSKDFFTPEGMRQKSEAASNLCTWVVNVVQYNEVWKMIKPKMDAEANAKLEYDAAALKLRQVEEKVAVMEAKLQAITDQYDQKNAEKLKVEREAQECQERLALAKRLVEGLADENTRWNKSITELNEKSRTLVGDVLLAASFVSYLGAFDQDYRVAMWKDTWTPDLISRKIPITENVDPLNVLAADSDFAQWKNEGLAADRTSLENGAIITKCARWPLLIDPQLQGIKWIRGRVKDLVVVQQNQPDYINTVIQAITTGQTLLIDNCGEELDATLEPILSRSIIQRGSRKYIKIGTDEILYNDDFKLFLQTKLANPHYRPEIFAQCTLINFIVTESGLEEQLLAVVVDREQPELEEKRTSLVRAINNYMLTLKYLEIEILRRLMDAPQDILSDVNLIESLEKTKSASLEIELKVAQSREQEITINEARNEFRPVAAEASWIYFLLIQLNNIAHMYQFSLNAFIAFFRKAMDRTAEASSSAERVQLLRESIRITVFTWVSRGLFEQHKLIFTSQLCFKLMMKGALKETFNAAYYDFLVRAPRKTSKTEKCLDWLQKSSWENVLYLSSLDGFEKLSKEMANSPNRFKEWYSKARPESSPLPLEWRKLDETNPFMKLLVVRALRPDRMMAAMENYVRQALPHGKSFTECDSGKSFLEVLSNSLDDSSPRNPIFFILSAGADPISSVEILAKKHGMYETKFHRIALGQGQDIVAVQRLLVGAREGHWVVLENIHLMPIWLKELEKILDDCDADEKTHADFRVFMSAEPNDDIPIGILERSLKLTNEPPRGLKQNLQRAFATFDKEHFDYCDSRVKSILFGLCHFHSIILERIKFGSKGWNRNYPFNTGDLLNSATVIQTYLEAANSNDAVPWRDIRYMVGEILYGGHITDDWDRLLCNTYLKFYLRDELLDEMELYPFCENHPEEHFKSPPILPFEQYFEYIDTQLVNESPLAFGLHPNEEIAVRTAQATTLFKYILELQPTTESSSSAEGGDAGMNSIANRVSIVLESIIERIKGINFHIDDIAQQLVDDRGPFQNVFLQECDRMNILVREMLRALRELNLGLSGELQMSERMEDLQNSLFFNKIPASWEKLAYPSLRSLMSWVDNVVDRASQLQDWVEEPSQVPTVVFIDKLFNPQSFLTAIMQRTAQKQRLELDKLVIQTDVTRKTPDEIDSRSRDGAYIAGLFLEGARLSWTSGLLEESAPREMFFEMPVISCKAIMAEKLERSGVYRCPVYKTQQRGNTYVFTALLKTKAPAEKWTLAGVSLVMESSDC